MWLGMMLFVMVIFLMVGEITGMSMTYVYTIGVGGVVCVW
jgi:hypothetical protein